MPGRHRGPDRRRRRSLRADNTHDNILFTAAVNEGLAKYCYRPDVRYVLVLNQDAYMDQDCVRHLVEFMDANPECGIACPLQYAQVAPGSRTVTWGGSDDALPFGRHRKDPIASYTGPSETFWANGACMMIRTEAIREVGLFDRNMRFICSDADFSFTARARGWKVFVVPAAVAEHSLGASSDASKEIQLAKSRDALYFMEKWLAGGVYRRLAYEGPALTRIGERQWAARLRRDIRYLERECRRCAGDLCASDAVVHVHPVADAAAGATPRRLLSPPGLLCCPACRTGAGCAVATALDRLNGPPCARAR